jgi:hypothetical protein
MSIIYGDAVDEIFGTVKAVNDTIAAGILGYTPELRWQSVPLGMQPAKDKFWLRASMMLVTEDQIALSAVNELRLFESIGILYVQLFCPRDIASSIENGRLLAVAIRDAFRQQSNSGEIWYKNQKVVELPETVESYPINVVVKFQYKTLHARGFNGTVGGGQVINFSAGEVPVGGPTIFTLANIPIAGSLALYNNGVRLRIGAGNDYTLSGLAITMLVTAGSLLADYRY